MENIYLALYVAEFMRKTAFGDLVRWVLEATGQVQRVLEDNARDPEQGAQAVQRTPEEERRDADRLIEGFRKALALESDILWEILTQTKGLSDETDANSVVAKAASKLGISPAEALEQRFEGIPQEQLWLMVAEWVGGTHDVEDGDNKWKIPEYKK